MRRAATLVVVLAATPARAGRMLYGWLPETETVPAARLELAMSIYEHDDLGLYHERSTALLLAPAFGVTRCLELAFPVELAARTQDDAAPWSGIARYGVELRFGFLRRWPAFRPLARFAVSRDGAIQTQGRAEAELAASYDYERLQVAADVDAVADVNVSHVHAQLRPGVGASVRVAGQLRLGAELHAELSGDTTATSWAVVGPDVSWTRGRFWVAGVVGIGVKNIAAAPRLNIGMAW
jgi:hypothetical protein